MSTEVIEGIRTAALELRRALEAAGKTCILLGEALQKLQGDLQNTSIEQNSVTNLLEPCPGNLISFKEFRQRWGQADDKNYLSRRLRASGVLVGKYGKTSNTFLANVKFKHTDAAESTPWVQVGDRVFREGGSRLPRSASKAAVPDKGLLTEEDLKVYLDARKP